MDWHWISFLSISLSLTGDNRCYRSKCAYGCQQRDNAVRCICPRGWRVESNGHGCVGEYSWWCLYSVAAYLMLPWSCWCRNDEYCNQRQSLGIKIRLYYYYLIEETGCIQLAFTFKSNNITNVKTLPTRGTICTHVWRILKCTILFD